jgi:hypothetical protein
MTTIMTQIREDWSVRKARGPKKKNAPASLYFQRVITPGPTAKKEVPKIHPTDRVVAPEKDLPENGYRLALQRNHKIFRVNPK